MNYTGPKVRLSRRIGIPLTPKASRIMETRKSPPGQHGANRRRGKVNDYSLQLLEKQKLRWQYNVSERQFRRYFFAAARSTANTGEKMVQLLEQRLDAFVLRSGFARTIYQARQLASHGHFFVNGRPVDIPSYQLRVGDQVSVRPRSRQLAPIRDSIRTAHPPAYIELDKANLSARLLVVPERADIPVVCDAHLVVEFYSR